MFHKLLLLFIIIPIVELAILIELSSRIGLIHTIIIIIITGTIGAALARDQGFKVFQRIKLNLTQGKIPADDLLIGVIILSGGLLLITPGLFTDIAGFIFIIPGTRKILKKLLKRKIKKYVYNNNYNIKTKENHRKYNEDDYIDIETEENDNN